MEVAPRGLHIVKGPSAGADGVGDRAGHREGHEERERGEEHALVTRRAEVVAVDLGRGLGCGARDDLGIRACCAGQHARAYRERDDEQEEGHEDGSPLHCFSRLRICFSMFSARAAELRSVLEVLRVAEWPLPSCPVWRKTPLSRMEAVPA
jgi:hypothetical protein